MPTETLTAAGHTVSMNADIAVPVIAAVVGVIVAVVRLIRPRRALSDWIWAAGMACISTEAFLGVKAALADSRDLMAHYQLYRLLVIATVPGIWLLFSLTFARGNAAALIGRRKAVFGLTVLGLPTFAFLLRDHVLGPVLDPNPDGSSLLNLGWAGVIIYVVVLVASIVIVMNLERTYRAAVGTMRWRIKYVIMGVGVLFVVRIYTSSQALLFHGVGLHLETLNSAALIVGSALITRSLFRTGKFDVEVYPSESVLQNSITVLLAGLYLVVVGILAKVAAFVGKDNSFALKTFIALLALVGLAVFLQSDRARLRMRRFVSRNFQRPLYDYRTVWRKFTEGTASRVEREDLCRALVKMVADVFQSLSVAIWLWDENKEGMLMTSSTFALMEKDAAARLEPMEASAMKAHFSASADAVDLDDLAAEWAAGITKLHPTQFPNGGHRVCVPLLSRGEVIGLITIGDRVGGVPFSLQDFDMLKCLADGAAAALSNVQLSQRLLQAKELEAFQTMAAFFVHDLKNAASTLNLMLQNLPVHFDDPAFREDALRGVSKTVTHINRLIGRLGTLRHEHRVQATEHDLNEVVAAGMAGLEQGAGSMITKELRPLPRIPLDREQFIKVVTNLVLNATEAVRKDGQIRVETRLEPLHAVLSVRDNGSGMSPEFIAGGLFRPFQTTKKTGLGIGMFQSKMIVEGHGGRIAVASESGKGTTFEVYLPLTAPNT